MLVPVIKRVGFCRLLGKLAGPVQLNVPVPVALNCTVWPVQTGFGVALAVGVGTEVGTNTSGPVIVSPHNGLVG